MGEGSFSDDQQTAAGYNIGIKHEALEMTSAGSIRTNYKVK